MTKYIYVLFFIYSSLGAVRDIPSGDSTTVVFVEHSPAKIMNSSLKRGKENDRSILCPNDILESDECPPMVCAAGICFTDGLIKICSASKALLVCAGIL
jgi:hypothetical protein